MRKEHQHTTKENYQTTWEESKRRKEQRRTIKGPENKQQNGNTYIPINNQFKCQWNKCSKQKPQCGR